MLLWQLNLPSTPVRTIPTWSTWGVSWGQAWGVSWGPIRTIPTWSTWGVSWGQAWGVSWGPIGAPTIFYQDQGGDDAWRLPRDQEEREAALSAELESTMRALVWHPRAVADVAAATAMQSQRAHVRHVATTAQAVMELRARQEEEQDDEDWVLLQ